MSLASIKLYELVDGLILQLIIGGLRFSLAANSAEHLQISFRVKVQQNECTTISAPPLLLLDPGL